MEPVVYTAFATPPAFHPPSTFFACTRETRSFVTSLGICCTIEDIVLTILFQPALIISRREIILSKFRNDRNVENFGDAKIRLKLTEIISHERYLFVVKIFIISQIRAFLWKRL